MEPRSDLAKLVETEVRLDASVVAAREAADAIREAAHARAREAQRSLGDRVARDRAMIDAVIAAETADRSRAIEERARADVARYERADIVELARELARRVAAIAQEDT